MAQSAMYTEEDIKNVELEEIKNTEAGAFEIDADELSFPSYRHHMTVRGKLEALAEKGVITDEEFSAVYSNWKSSKQ